MKIASLALAAALVAAAPAAAVTFTLNTNGGTGSVLTNTGSGFSFLITGSDGGSGLGISTNYVAVNPFSNASRKVTGTWSFTSYDADGASFDPAGYINGGSVQLTSAGPSGVTQSGTFSFIVAPSATYGFYVFSTDDSLGPAQLHIENLSVGGVPEPASWAMLIAGFGLVGAVARRRKALAAA